MSSWCYNDVVLLGDVEAIQAFKLAVCRSQRYLISAVKSCPFPSDLSSDDWAEWRLENWGMLWDLTEFNKSYDVWMRPIEHSISFQSVEFPPIPLFKMLSEKHPDVSISLRYLNAASSEFQYVYIYRGVVDKVPDPSKLSWLDEVNYQ